MDSEDSKHFKKSIILTSLFFFLTPVVILISLVYLFNLRSSVYKTEKPNIKISNTGISGSRIFASVPENVPSIDSYIQASDARIAIVKKYLETYNSQLSPYAAFIVSMADKYSVDFRLIPAIAQQESNLCKSYPAGTYNCWGWGIYGDNILGFDSYEHAIETVTRGLKYEYIDKGMTTPDEIMAKYTPPSKGSWAYGVSQFLSEME